MFRAIQPPVKMTWHLSLPLRPFMNPLSFQYCYQNASYFTLKKHSPFLHGPVTPKSQARLLPLAQNLFLPILVSLWTVQTAGSLSGGFWR